MRLLRPKYMLEHLFGSKTRIKLLRLFLNNPKKPYFVRELSRQLESQINSVRRELQNLEKIGIIEIVTLKDGPVGKDRIARKNKKAQKKFFKANPEFILYGDLKGLLMKGQILLERKFVNKLKGIGNISYLALSGIFAGREDALTDILIVGRINRPKLRRLIKSFEKDIDREVRFTIFSVSEFEYRRNITDKFLYDMLDNKKIVLIDKINK